MEHYLIEDDGTVISSSQHHSFRSINKNMTPLLGVILTVEPCDNDNNLSLGVGVYRGVRHECTVLCSKNLGFPDILIPNVIITPPSPSNIDNYSENIPRGCTNLIDGHSFDSELVGVNPYRLDGEWCIVNFINSNSVYPYISNWFPHPANIFDPSTSGREVDAGDTTGTYLIQADIVKGKSRSYNSSNGVINMLSLDGNTYYDTQEAGRKILIDEENNRKVVNVAGGGHIQVDIKQKAQMELNWNSKPIKGPRIGAGSNSSNPIQEKSFPHYDDPTKAGTPEARETKRTTIRNDQFSILQKTSQFNVLCEDQTAEEGGKAGECTVSATDSITLAVTPEPGEPANLIQVADGQIMITVSDGTTVAVSEDKINLATSGGGSIQLQGGLLSILAADGIVMNTPVSMGVTAVDGALKGTTFASALGIFLGKLTIYVNAIKTVADPIPPNTATTALNEAITTLGTALLASVSSQVKVS